MTAVFRLPAAAIAAAAIACALLASPAPGAQFPGTQVTLLSRTPAGRPAAGTSTAPVISRDRRWARVVAFQSDTPDLTPGTAPGVTNVFTVSRAEPFGDNGTPWEPGPVRLASAGLGGAPANGDSYGASLGGTSRLAPRCVAFVSNASNLVPGDTNGQPDAFVRDLVTGRIVRVSVSSGGRQADGPTSAVAVDGRCDAVALVSTASNLALTHTRRISWHTAVTRRPAPGTAQVYVRFLGGPRGIDRAVKGLTFLASANRHHAPGSGDSTDPVFAADGRALAFASTATNLAGVDRNGASDVFERTLHREYGRRVHGHSPQFYRLRMRLVSETERGRRGDGASTSPSINADGSDVAYQTTAANIIGRHAVTAQVVRADMTHVHPETSLASRGRSGGPANGSSGAPSITEGGTWVFFSSAATDVASRNRAPRGAGPTAFLWSQRGSEIFALTPTAGVSSTPHTSPHGNYVVFARGGQVWLLYIGPE